MSTVGHRGENLARIIAGSVLALCAALSVVLVLTDGDGPASGVVDGGAPAGVPGGSGGSSGSTSRAPQGAGDGSRPPPATREELMAAFPYPRGSRPATLPFEPSLPSGWVQEVRFVRRDLPGVVEFYEEQLMRLSLSFTLSPATSGGETVAYLGGFNTADYALSGSIELEKDAYADTSGGTTITVTFR